MVSEKMSRNKLVMSTTKAIINSISSNLKEPSSKAKLANLRNSLGRPLDQSLPVMQIVFENMPEEFFSSYKRLGNELSKEELAIFTSIQLYAMFQQSKYETVDYIGEKGDCDNIGASLSAIRTIDASASTDHRFNAMITSQTFEELVIHLRHLIKLLKSKSKETKINFAKLSGDLYSFLNGYQDSIRLNWSRSYYSRKEILEEKGEENEK